LYDGLSDCEFLCITKIENQKDKDRETAGLKEEISALKKQITQQVIFS
jgi:hypothetical protein